MPVKSGLSHGSAAFTSLLVGSVISEYISMHSHVLRRAATLAGRATTASLGLELSGPFVGLVVVSTTLAFLWGVLYHVRRH